MSRSASVSTSVKPSWKSEEEILAKVPMEHRTAVRMYGMGYDQQTIARHVHQTNKVVSKWCVKHKKVVEELRNYFSLDVHITDRYARDDLRRLRNRLGAAKMEDLLHCGNPQVEVKALLGLYDRTGVGPAHKVEHEHTGYINLIQDNRKLVELIERTLPPPPPPGQKILEAEYEDVTDGDPGADC